ncbi:MAG: hypothetical protein QXP04_03325, partial [Candidatus Nanoarchaeia archaeon]|nr:hypothetical protein [Candidatus Jingweiarchaeum tengchongense]
DFRGAIRANIGTEIQLRTKYEGDIGRVKQKYGPEYSATLPKLRIGSAMVQNPDYNDGKPYFIEFRPLLHDTFRITNEELETYKKLQESISEIEKKIKDLKDKKIDTYDIEIELGLAKEKLKQGLTHMAETYIESMKEKLKRLEK